MNPNTKREFRRFSSKYGKTFEPVMVVIILAIFAIPILTVINLTPETRSMKSNNVLGVQDTSQFTIDTVGGNHDIIKDEIVLNTEDGNKEYKATISPHSSGKFSKPIFTFKNNTLEQKEVKIIARTESRDDVKLGVIYKDTNYILQGSNGEVFFHTLVIEPQSEQTLYLTLETDKNVAFNESVNLSLLVQ